MGPPGPQRLDQHRRSGDLHVRSARGRCGRRPRRTRVGALPPAGPLDGRHRRPALGARAPRTGRVADPHGHPGRAGAVPPREWIDNTVSMGRDQGMGAVADLMARFTMSSSVASRTTGRGSPSATATSSRTWTSRPSRRWPRSCGASRACSSGWARSPAPPRCSSASWTPPLRDASDSIAKAIPGADLVVIEGAAHCPQEERRDAWLAAVRQHLG